MTTIATIADILLSHADSMQFYKSPALSVEELRDLANAAEFQCPKCEALLEELHTEQDIADSAELCTRAAEQKLGAAEAELREARSVALDLVQRRDQTIEELHYALNETREELRVLRIAGRAVVDVWDTGCERGKADDALMLRLYEGIEELDRLTDEGEANDECATAKTR